MLAWIVPVMTAAISACGALVSVWYGRRSLRAERMDKAEDLAARFREPLLQAIFNLETRIYNIVELGFLQKFLGDSATDDERAYAIDNTLYVLAQYFCWVEILRRESQYVDPRNSQLNRRVAHEVEEVRDLFADSSNIASRSFRIFRGEQRALGELLLVPSSGVSIPAPRWECLGYAAFVESLSDQSTERWWRRLRCDIEQVPARDATELRRLQLVHGGLIDIIDVLDPENLRIPPNVRRRLSGAPLPVANDGQATYSGAA
jgi:hypothetical protein